MSAPDGLLAGPHPEPVELSFPVLAGVLRRGGEQSQGRADPPALGRRERCADRGVPATVHIGRELAHRAGPDAHLEPYGGVLLAQRSANEPATTPTPARNTCLRLRSPGVWPFSSQAALTSTPDVNVR